MKTDTKKDSAYIAFLKNKKNKQYRLRISISGIQKNYYFDSETEALAFRDEAKTLQDKVYKKGDVVHFSVLTLFREWIREKELTVSSSSIVDIRNSFKHLSYLNGSWLSQVSKSDCLELMKTDCSQSLKNAFSTLSEMNKYALEKYNYGFTWNIDDLRKGLKPKVKSHKRVRSFYREDEIVIILNYLKSKDLYWFHFFRLSFSLGARIGEICSLKKSNYHKSEKILVLDSTLQSAYVDGKVIIQDSDSTKNGESRIISLNESAIESIDYFLSLDKKKESPFIITKKTKSKYIFLSKSIVNFVLKDVSEKLGLIYLPSHCAFRKTFATMVALKSKKSHRDMISAIQKQLGHKSPQMTLYYIQSIELGLTDELNELDKILNTLSDD